MISIILTILGFILPLIADHLKSSRGYLHDKKKFNSFLVKRSDAGITAMFEQLRNPGIGNNSLK